jgi:very-short-patch-repair endonuclease
VDERLAAYLQGQLGVVARRQALAAGLTPEQVARLVRRRELAPIHPGVYVDHTGEPTWTQLAWAAVLHTWPAALSHGSALGVAEGQASPHRTLPVEVVVLKDRHLGAPSGVRLHRSRHAPQRTVAGSPPRIRYEEAVLDVAARMRSVDEVVAELGRVVQARRTTAARLLAALNGRERIRQRALLAEVLGDVAAGASSSLERAYLVDVERSHGLPAALRQSREHSILGVVFRDAVYVLGGRRLVVELDGRAYHDTARQRNADFDRDLLLRLAGEETIRLSWSQVRGRPCWTAGVVGQLLRTLGWAGGVRRCGADCEAVRDDPDVRRTA